MYVNEKERRVELSRLKPLKQYKKFHGSRGSLIPYACLTGKSIKGTEKKET